MTDAAVEIPIELDETFAAALKLSIRSLPLSTRARNALLDVAIGWRMFYDINNDGTIGQVHDHFKLTDRSVLRNGKWERRTILTTKNVGPQTASEIRAVLIEANVPLWMVDDIAPALKR